jgi:hypothetical protein
MFFPEFSTLPEPTQRSGHTLSFPQLFFFEICTKSPGAYDLPLVTEARVPRRRFNLEVCVYTGNRCGKFQIGTAPEKKKRQQGCHTPKPQNFVRQIFEDSQISPSSICRLCLDRVFT